MVAFKKQPPCPPEESGVALRKMPPSRREMSMVVIKKYPPCSREDLKVAHKKRPPGPPEIWRAELMNGLTVLQIYRSCTQEIASLSSRRIDAALKKRPPSPREEIEVSLKKRPSCPPEDSRAEQKICTTCPPEKSMLHTRKWVPVLQKCRGWYTSNGVLVLEKIIW
jgi:hypothetical protein